LEEHGGVEERVVRRRANWYVECAFVNGDEGLADDVI
jgi:hypothetical protein